MRRAAAFRAALVGADHPHAPLLYRTLQNLPEVTEIAVCPDSLGAGRPEWAQRDPKLRLIARDLTTLLKCHDPDFVVVCTRTDRAAELAQRVLEAGAPLLIDKPAGLTATAVSALDRLARKRDVKAAVLYGQRFHPAIRAARREIECGLLGRLLTVEARLITTQVRFRNPASWLFSRAAAGGGILTWLGCHYLDLIPHVLGDPIAAVSAQFATRSGEPIDVEDVAALTLRFRSGAIGTLHTGYVLAQRGAGYGNPRGFDNYLACNGSAGRIVWRGTTSRSLHCEKNRVGTNSGTVRQMRFRLRETNSYGGAVGERFVRQFIAALRDGAEVPATLADAAQVLRVIEAATRSAKTGRLEEID